jgi:trypsin-like peptidase
MIRHHGTSWRRVLGVFILVALNLGSATHADDGGIQSPAKLPVIGRIQILSGEDLIKLYPLRDGVCVQNVDFSGTTSFRLHFSVLNAPQSGSRWTVKILSFEGNQERWKFTSEENSRGFWSSEIKGSRARVVITTEGPDRDLQIIIDKVVHMDAIVTPLSVINGDGDGNLRPINQMANSIQRSGRSVARLVIQRDGDELSQPCTGFLVGRDLLLTNRHCIKSGSEAENTDVQFDYDRDGVQPVQAKVRDLLLTSCDLDFVLLRLDRSFACVSAACNTASERAPLILSRNGTLTVGQRLVAIQHPEGAAKQAAKDGCIVDQLQTVGSSSSFTDFSHKCDTKDGSSGTPLQLLGPGDVVGPVVGLHHLGIRKDNVAPGEPRRVNRAVSIRQIVGYITQIRPALANELAQ